MSNSNSNILLYNKNKVLDIISCAICLEKFKHPRNLDCGHSYCTTCLHLIKLNDEIVCPLCRHITSFNNRLLIDLPVNNILVSLIDETDVLNNTTLRKSKSVDSFIKYKKSKKKKTRNILYQDNNIFTSNFTNTLEDNNINNNINNNDIICRECCSFQ